MNVAVRVGARGNSGHAGVRRTLCVAFIGGAHRSSRELSSLGEDLGIQVEVHDGHIAGPSRERLGAVVRRADIVVLVTGIVSHASVREAKREAARSGTRVCIVKSCGTTTARAFLEEVALMKSA